MAFVLTFILIFIFSSFGDLSKYSHQKMKEFECGFNIINNNRLSFSNQYFLITILFLIFDLEIVLIVPIILENLKISKELIFLNFLIIVLAIGLIVE